MREIKPPYECSCESCKKACAQKPGWFEPEQIEPLSRNLGITPQELFDKHLQIDFWTDVEDVYVLSPRVQDAEGGTMFPHDPRGTCHWFKNGKCQIHNLGKPAECAMLKHNPNGTHELYDREIIVAKWKKNQKMIEDLSGKKPDSNYGLFDALYLFMTLHGFKP